MAPIMRIMEPMERKVAVVYTVFSVLSFIALTTWFAFSFFQTKANNLIAAANTFVDVKNSVGVAVNTQGNLKTPSVREYVRSLFLQDPAVDLISISSPQGDVLYIYSRRASYLVPPLVQKDQFVGSIRYSKMTQRLFTAELPPATASSPPDKITAVFTVLSRNDIYSLARVVLIALIAFVILTGIVILILPLLRRETPSRTTHPGARPADAEDRNDESTNRQSESASSESTPSPQDGTPSPPVNELPRGTHPIVLPEPPASTTPTEEPADIDEVHSSPEEPPADDSVAHIQEVDLSQTPDQTPMTQAPTDHELPEEVRLPALTEVLGEDPELTDDIPEIALYSGIDEEPPAPETPEILAAPSPSFLEPDGDLEVVEDEAPTEMPHRGEVVSLENEEPVSLEAADLEVEVTEIEEHAVEPQTAGPEAPSYRSTNDELEDIEDFEDLEALDGHVSPEPPEPAPKRRATQTAQPAVQPPAAPEPDQIGLDEPEELLEIPEDAEIPPEEAAFPEEDTLEPPPAIELSPEEQLILEPPEGAESLNELDLYDSEQPLLDDGSGDVLTEELPEIPEIEELESAETTASAAPNESPSDEEQTAAANGAPPAAGFSRDLFNPESGLAWSDHLEQRLSFELDRAASFDQDLSLALLRFASPANSVVRLSYANDIRSYFPFRDLCFEYDESSFAIVLPNSDIDQAIRTMENFNTRETEERPNAPRVFIGLSARNGRLLGGERLLTEAETAVTKAHEDGKNAIFALRVDPGKYREYIKSSLK